MRKAACAVTTFLFLPLLLLRSGGECLEITKEGAAYKGLVLAIHRDVPESQELLKNIQAVLVKASSYLFRATGGRAYFQEVMIVLPSTWSSDLTTDLVHRDFYEFSHIRVGEPNPDYGDAPYTLQPGGCAEPGLYLHLTPKFILHLDGWTKEMFGEPDRQLVHEWAHFRYGVFDEYGVPGDSRYPMFYQHDGKMFPTSCVRDVSGWIESENGSPCVIHKGGQVGPDCIFIPDTSGPRGTGVTASIMYMPFLPEIEGFCDDSEDWRQSHNWRAPSRQNDMCQHRSTWDVIRSHQDFQGVNGDPESNMTDVTPRFQVVRKDDHQRTVLVLDNSGSMKGTPLKLLHEAASRFIMDTVPANSSLGLVQFSSTASIRANLTLVKSKLVRMSLVSQIPKSAAGSTAIGDGLLKALQVLTKFGRQSARGAMILLITDGEETEGPRLAEVLPTIQASGASVNCIAFGSKATEKLELLSRKTAGKAFLYPNLQGPVSALDSAFYQTVTVQSDVEVQPVTLKDSSLVIGSGETKEVQVVVDQDVGLKTIFTFRGIAIGQIDIQLRDPNGTIYNFQSEAYFEDVRVRAYKMFSFDKAQAGRWNVLMRSRHEQQSSVSWTAVSSPLDESDQPVRVRSWFGQVELQYPARAKIFAQVSKGHRPVLNATANAIVHRPNAKPFNLDLRDNGAGADAVRNDGIYSGHFNAFTGQGRYSAMVNVVNDGYAILKKTGLGPWARAPTRPRILPGVRDRLGEPSTSFEINSFSISSETMPESDVEGDPARDFVRNVNPGSFSVVGYDPLLQSEVPPGRITDLSVVASWRENNEDNVKIIFTIPDDSTGDGNDLSFEIRTQREDNFLLIRDFPSAPLLSLHTNVGPTGSVQTLVLSLGKAQNVSRIQDVYLAVRTISAQGSKSEISNLVSVHFGYLVSDITYKYKSVSSHLFLSHLLEILALLLAFHSSLR